MPIFRDLCLQSARMYLEFCEHLLRIQKHAAIHARGYMRAGDVYIVLGILIALLQKKKKLNPSHYNYHGAHICF